MPQPKFISLEGGEGTGKSTQADLLTQSLRAWGVEVEKTHEPGGTDSGEEIRKLIVSGRAERWDAMCESLLYFIDRRHHMVNVIWPALKCGRWVVCDRFVDSTMAYQSYGLRLGREKVTELHETVIDGFSPSLTLILDLPIEIGLARVRQRGEVDRYESMDLAFHQRIRDGFLDIARREPERCAVIDAGPAHEEVHANILGVVRGRLGLG